jgi:hypothetical protein
VIRRPGLGEDAVMSRRHLLPAAAASLTALTLLAPAVAGAGTVRVEADRVVFEDAAAENNAVDVTWTPVTGDCGDTPVCLEVRDREAVAVEAGPGCLRYDNIPYIAYCGMTATRPVVVELGAGQDFLNASVVAGEEVIGRGGPGNDRLYGSTGATTLDGGEGDDELYPDDNPYSASRPTPGPDTLAGGPGTDKVSYVDHPSRVRVSLDGVANDGGAADVDNVAPDVEGIIGSLDGDELTGNGAANEIDARAGDDRISGGAGDDKLFGGQANDAIDGGAGNDHLEGGPDNDTIAGGPGTDSFFGDFSGAFGQVVVGNDSIDARDGAAEPVSCGPGADTASVDIADTVASDPQNACENVQRAAAVSAFVSIPAQTLRPRSNRVRVRIACRLPQGQTCRGRLRLRARGATLGSAPFSVRAGRTARVTVKLGRAGRSLLRRNRRLRVRIEATPRGGGKAVARRVTLRR